MVASLVIDIILAVIACILIIRYTKKGFVKTVLDFLKTVIAIFLAYALRNHVAKLIDSMFMNKTIVGWVNKSLTAVAGGENAVVDFSSIYEDVPSFYTNVLSKFGLDLEKLDEQFKNLTAENINALSENIGSSLSFMISVAVAVIAIFAVAIVALTIVVHLLNLLTRFRGVDILNKFLGLVFGVALSAVIMWGASFLVMKAIEWFGPMYPDALNENIINNSVILKFFCKNNLLDIVLGWFKKS